MRLYAPVLFGQGIKDFGHAVAYIITYNVPYEQARQQYTHYRVDKQAVVLAVGYKVAVNGTMNQRNKIFKQYSRKSGKNTYH